MAVTNTPDKSEMKACPFCGVGPYFGGDTRRGWIAQCVNDGCGVKPAILRRKRAEAIAAWNTRASSRPPADQVPDMVERLGETLHDLSDSLRQIGFFSGERKHIARYEAVVSAFENLGALQAVPTARVDRLPENYELSHGPLNGDMSDCAWQVHSVNGGYNDREWTLVATGETPSEAIIAALKAQETGE